MSSASVSNSRFSTRAMTVFAMVAAVTFSATSSAPTPLYHFYQESMALSPFLLTVIFAVYALSLLAALLTVGSLSDYIGRRPMIFAGLAFNAVALLMFIEADSAAVLIAARIIQGFGVGIATTTLGAAILDTDRARGPMLNSVSAFAGLTVGSLTASLLVSFAPLPAQLVYLVLLGVTLVLGVILLGMPETTVRRPGGLASLKPRVLVPPAARGTLLRVSPVNIAAWALGGFNLSLMPSLVRLATGINSPLLGGAVVASLMASATLSVVLVRSWPAPQIVMRGTAAFALGVAITLGGIYLQSVPLLFVGTIASGLGFGSAFAGILRTLLPLAEPNERAGLLSAFYVESYLAFSLPAIVAGLLAPQIGLQATAYGYGVVVILLAIVSLVATRVMQRA